MQILKNLTIAFVSLVLSSFAYGQAVASGDLHVTVKDPKGSLVTGATVTVRDEAKGIERIASPGGAGEYNARTLPPASYTVTVSAQGFANAQLPGVVITVGGSEELPVTLGIAGATETVEVSAVPDVVETTRSSATHTVSQKEIDNWPINGRNYINYTLTDSQVVRDNAPNTGAAPTSGLNMSGQRARSNLVNVDGADATDNSVNGVRSTVSQEAVQEFQIITNSYAAEYGRAAGGVVNIVTRSGDNGFHGDVFGYLRNRAFQAVNPFSTVSDPAYTRVQAGAAFGGAIKKDKTFYYFSYEVTRRHETGFSSIGSDNFGLQPFDTTQIGLPFGTLSSTPDQIAFLTNPATLAAEGANPTGAFAQSIGAYVVLAGASSGQAVNGAWPSGMVEALTGGALSNWARFPTSCAPPGPCASVPASYQTLASQRGNFPVFEGTSLYSLRIDHNMTSTNRLTFRANVSPSTINGIEVSGEDQPFGQNAYSRTSQQTYRDVAGVVQDTWTHRQQQGQRIPLPIRAPRVVIFLQHDIFPAARTPLLTLRDLRTSGVSRTLTFNAPRSDISSPTISPGISASTTRSLARTSTSFRCKGYLHRKLWGRLRLRLVQCHKSAGSALAAFPGISPMRSKPMAADFPAATCRVWAAPAIPSTTSPWGSSGRIPGARVRISL